jgi:hypothetical protein
MGKKSFGFGKRIIARHPRDIERDIAENRPIGGSIGVTEGGSIFTKNHIFDERANDFQFPNAVEFLRQR